MLNSESLPILRSTRSVSWTTLEFIRITVPNSLCKKLTLAPKVEINSFECSCWRETTERSGLSGLPRARLAESKLTRRYLLTSTESMQLVISRRSSLRAQTTSGQSAKTLKNNRESIHLSLQKGNSRSCTMLLPLRGKLPKQ